MDKARKILFLILAAVCVITVILSAKEEPKNTDVKIYVTDAEMMRLIPITVTTKERGTDAEAKYVIARLIEGFDDNPKIRRTIPKIKKGITVKTKGDTAYVNISEKVRENHLEGVDAEKLTVYSIVNSLLETDGINRVRFTIGGKSRKNFMGHIDMREIFASREII